MTSARKIRANRANARVSSGPKTAAGKAQSAQNAFRHGFNVPIWLDPDLAGDVEALAQRIVGKGADANVLEPARRVAEAQIDLRRVRSYRHRLIERAISNPQVQAEAAEPAPLAPSSARGTSVGPCGGVHQDPRSARSLHALREPVGPSAAFARELAALDRYERRALSRLKFAIRARLRARRGRTPRPRRRRGALPRGRERRSRRPSLRSWGRGLIRPATLSFAHFRDEWPARLQDGFYCL